MKKFLRFGLSVAVLLLANTTIAETFDFTSSLPSGWTSSGTVSWSWNAFGGDRGGVARADVRSMSSGTLGLLRSAPLGAPDSGNVFVSLLIRNESSTKNDYLQVVGTTNNWVSTFTIGGEIPRYDASTSDAWRQVSVSTYIEGLAGRTDFRVGFTAKAGGISGKYIYIDDVSVSYKSSASPQSLRFCDELGNELASIRGDTGNNFYVAVDVLERPPADITNLVVSLQHIRNGVTNTWTSSNGTLVRLGETSIWRSQFAIPPFEAGETNALKATTTYTSKSGLNTLSPETAVRSTSVVPGLGGVWINEIDALHVEISAPTNRTTLAGWTLVAEPEIGNAFVIHTFSEAMAFTNGVYNGVGYLLADLDSSLQAGAYAVQLVNSVGFVESAISGVKVPMEAGCSFSARGNVPWLGANWDWANASAYFTWTNTVSSFGERNPLQGVNIAALLNVNIQTVVVSADASETNGLASAQCDITAQFSGGNVSDSAATGSDGWTGKVELSGTHTDGTVDVGIAATAFGWASEPREINMVLGTTSTNFYESPMLPSVATDSFDSGFLPYWTKTSPDWWSSFQVSGNLRIRCDLRSISAGSSSRLGVSNPLRTRGKHYASLSLKTLNAMPADSNRTDRIRASFGTGTVWSASSALAFPDALNRYPSFATDSWVDFMAVRELPSSVLPSSDLKFAIQGIAGGISGKYAYMDDLRIAFQDMVTAENLRMEPVVPKSGQGVAVLVDLVPWAAEETSVSNVSAKLYYKLNGGATTYVDFKIGGNSSYPLADDTTVTISKSEFEAAVGKFNEGDTFEYWVEVSYDADNADPNPSLRRETRYCPDNSTIDPTTGAWMVIGTYAADPVQVVAMGVQSIWFNEVCPNPTSNPTLHYVELAGVTNTAIGGWTLEVRDLAAGDVLAGTHLVPADTTISTSPVNDYGFYVFGGSGITPKNQALTCALPVVGGLVLKDADGYTRYSYNYSATGVSADVAGYENLGSANGTSLIAYGEGNPANRDFAWTNTVDITDKTPSGVNPNQSFTNGGPYPVAFTSVIPSQNSVAVCVAGSDLDKPVEYRLKLNSGAWSGWSTNRTGYLFEGLSENTYQTIQLQARDSWANESAVTTNSIYTLLATPSAPIVSGSATDAVSVSASVPNLGVGNTMLKFEGTAGQNDWQTADEWTLDGLAVNTQYAFTVMARNGDGVETGLSGLGYGYTLAMTPTSTVALEKSSNRINLDFSAAYDPETNVPVDGNPDYTEYSVMTELAFKDGSVVTNYIALNGNTVATNCWNTLPAWQSLATNGTWGARVDITATNIAFRLVACNGDYVATAPGPADSTFFEMTVAPVSATQVFNGNGLVSVVADLSNPWTNACNVALKYSTNAGGSWTPATLTGAVASYGDVTVDMPQDYPIRGVETDSEGTNTVWATWNARADLGSIVTGPIWFKWDAEDPSGGKPADSAIATNAFASLDLQPPSITNVVCNQTSPTKISPLTFTVTFSEPVNFTNNAAITVSNGTVSGVSASPSPNATWVVSVTPSITLGTVSITAISASAAADVVGNRSTSWSGSESVTYDAEKPSVVLSSTSSVTNNLASYTVTATFVEPVSGLTLPEIQVTNGTASNLLPASGLTSVYTFTVTPGVSAAQTGQDVTVIIPVNVAQDVAGNDNTASAPLVRRSDQVAPSVVLSSTSSVTNNLASFTVTATFVEPVSGLTLPEIQVTNGTASNLLPASGFTSVYTFTVTPEASAVQTGQDVTVTILANAAQDVAGNDNTVSAPLVRRSDRVAPSVVLSSTSSVTNNLASFTVTATFAEPVSGLTLPEIQVMNGTASNLLPASGLTSVYTFTVTPGASAVQTGQDVTVTILANAAQDVAGNDNTVSSPLVRRSDRVAPSLNITRANNPATTNATTLVYTLVPSEPVFGLDASDVSIVVTGTFTNQGTVQSLVKVNDLKYTITVAGIAGNGTHGVRVLAGKCTDEAGNANTLSTHETYTIDQAQPGCTITRHNPATADTNASTLEFKVTFTENVYGFSASDVQAVATGVTGDQLSVTGSLKDYTVTAINISGNGQFGINVPAGGCKDLAGNTNTEGATVSYHVDTVPPDAALAPLPNSPTNATSWVFSVTGADVVSYKYKLDSGSWSAETPTATGINLSSLTGGNHTISVIGKDLAGNWKPEGSAYSYTWIVDATVPQITRTQAPSNPTNDCDVIAAYTVTDSSAATILWRLDTGEWMAPAGAQENVFAVQANGLSEGNHVLEAYAVDVAGNVGAVNSYSWIIDLTAPTCTILTNGATAVKNSAEFTVKFSEAVRGLDKSQFSVFPSGSVSTLTQVSPSNYTATVTGFAADAVAVGLTLPARVCSDIAGNKNQAGSLAQYKVDGVAPVIKNVAATPARVKTGAAVTLEFDVVDDSPLASVKVNGTIVTGTPPHYSYTYNNSGSGTVTIIATDTLGNASTSTVTTAFVVDNTAPTFTWTGMPSGTTQTTSFGSTVSITAEADTNRQYMWTLDSVTKQAWTFVPGSGSVAIAANGLTDGLHTAVLTIRDSAENETTQTKTWIVDTTGPTVSVVAGAQGGNGALFTVTLGSGGILDTSAVYATTTAGLSAEIGSISGSGTSYTFMVTNIFGTGRVTVTAPAGSVKDAVGNGNPTAASDFLDVSYTKAAPKVSLAFDRRMLNADRLQWILSSDQPLTGLTTGKFSVKRFGLADADVTVASVTVSTPATNAVISVTENDWKTEASHLPFMLVFNSDNSVTSTNGITAGVITNIASEVNLLIPKHGGTLTINTASGDGSRFADGSTTEGTSCVAPGKQIKYSFQTNSVVRKIAFAPPATTENFLTHSDVVLTLAGGGTQTYSFDMPIRQSYSFDIHDVMVQSITFTNFVGSGSPSPIVFFYELAAMGCPAGSDTAGPDVGVSRIGPVETTGTTVQFRLDCNEDNQLAAGSSWNDAVDASGVTVGGLSVITNGFGRSYVVTLTGLSGAGSVALSIPSGFVVDAAGNGCTAVVSEAFIVDRSVPTAEFISPIADNTAATTGMVAYRIQFSEPVHGLDISDFTLTANTATAAVKSIAQVAGVANGYDILVSVAWSDTDTVSLSLDASAVTDALGNVSGGTVSSKTYRFVKQVNGGSAVLVVASAGANGYVNPAGTNVVASGGSQSIVVTADEGYSIASLTQNGTSVPAAVGLENYTLAMSAITSDITVAATFQIRSNITLTLNKTGSGSLTPYPSLTVSYGGDATVAAKADAGNRIQSVTVGGVAQPGAVGKTDYLVTLSNLTVNTTIGVLFEKIPDVTLTVTAGEGGTATPSGITNILYGGNVSVSVEATVGYAIDSVTVNGASKPAAVGADSYTVSLFDLTGDVIVRAEFVLEDVPENEIPFGNGSIWIIADVEHPVSFSEIMLGTVSASVSLDATIGSESGATTEDAYLIVQTELGGATTNTLEGSIDTNGKVEFVFPAIHGKLFFIGIGNSNWSPLQEF